MTPKGRLLLGLVFAATVAVLFLERNLSQPGAGSISPIRPAGEAIGPKTGNAAPVPAPLPREVPTAKTQSSASVARPPDAFPPGASRSVRLVAGHGRPNDYVTRMSTLHALGTRLSPADIDGLYAFLHSGVGDHPGLDKYEVNALKNDALQVLIAQETIPSGLLEEILGMYRDPAVDVLWRHYCLQHIAMYIQRRWPPADAGRTDDPDYRKALAAYEEALTIRGGGFAGTAMLGLARLSMEYPDVGPTRVGSVCLESALNEREDVATRVTAIALCGTLGQTNVLSRARIVAQVGEVMPLRLAAIGTFGLVWTMEDMDLMKSLAASGDHAISKAARTALGRLLERQR